jgi:putative SbcD/Mre11-related phosphoesterase
MKEIEFIGKCLLINTNGKKILVIGDLHLGYEGALRETGVLIRDEVFKEYIKEIDRVFEIVKKKILSPNGKFIGNGKSGDRGNENINNKDVVDEIVLLGDVKHVIGKVIREEWNEVVMFLDYLKEKCGKIIIVKGQHDALLEPIVRKLKNVSLVDYYVDEEYAFVHGDKKYIEINDKKIKYWIMGNAHPAVKISDDVKVEKYKCFLVGKYKIGIGNVKEVIICPSFIYANEGSDAGGGDLGMAREFNYDKFRVIVVSEDMEDLDFGELGKIK